MLAKADSNPMPAAQRRTGRTKSPPPVTADGQIDLAAVPEVYAMACVGDCMEPEIADGSTLAFDKLAPCRVGDVVAIWKRPELIKPGDPPALVKRLTYEIPFFVTFPYKGHQDDFGSPLLIVAMNNPPRRLAIRCEDVLAVHRYVGVVERSATGAAIVPKQKLADIRAGRA